MNKNCIIKRNDQQKKITKINWIENKYQIADCLTKHGASSEKLLNTKTKTKSPNLQTKSIEAL